MSPHPNHAAAMVKLAGRQVPVTVTTQLQMPPEDGLGAPTEVPLTVVLALSAADAARVAELAPEETDVVPVAVHDKVSGRAWLVARGAGGGLVALPYRPSSV